MQALCRRLLQLIEETWCGTIDFRVGDQSIGRIVVSEGMIAWARCQAQTETLGVFMWRMGRLTKSQLQQVQQVYAQHHGAKKLGEIVQEMGFMNQTVFRRCLLLHTRSAVEKLLSRTDAELHSSPSAPQTNEGNLFNPDEVLPAGMAAELFQEWMCPDNTPVRKWRKRTAENAVLDDVIALPGFQAAALLSGDGDVLTAYLRNSVVDPAMVGAFIAGMMEQISRVAAATSFSPVEFILLDHPGGTLAIHRIGDEQQHLLALLLDQTNGPAFARHAMKLACGKTRAWLAGQASDSPTGRRARATPLPVAPVPAGADAGPRPGLLAQAAQAAREPRPRRSTGSEHALIASPGPVATDEFYAVPASKRSANEEVVAREGRPSLSDSSLSGSSLAARAVAHEGFADSSRSDSALTARGAAAETESD